jgi:hypothetical protein
MSYGLLVLSSTGKVQIDETWQGYYQTQSGSIACNGTFTLPDFIAHGLTLNEDDLIFARPNHTWAQIATINAAGESADIGLVGEYIFAAYEGSISYKVFSKTGRASEPTGYGLVVYNAAGNIVFSSNEPGPRIIGLIAGLPGNTSLLWSGGASDPVPYCLMNCHQMFDQKAGNGAPSETDFTTNYWHDLFSDSAVKQIHNSFLTLYGSNTNTINIELTSVLYAAMDGT